ncbi:MAG: hypothetical protein ACKOHK_00505, partial [Planctomycetia bacterium]
VTRDAAAGRSRDRTATLVAAGERVGDLESARLLGWVLQAALREDGAANATAREAVIADLGTVLALDFPSPAYPEPPSTQKPFWQTSLSAAADADIDRIHAAFRQALNRP